MTTEGPPQQNPEQAGIQKAEQLLDYMECSFGRNASPEGRQAFDFNKFWTDAKDLAGVKKGGIAILETPDFHLPFASYGANKELWGNVINALADEAEDAYRNGNTSEKQKEVRKGLAVAVALGMNNTHGDHYLTATKEFIEGLRKIYGTKEPEEKFGNRVKQTLTGRFRKIQPRTNQIRAEQTGQAEETVEENPFADLIGELDSLAEQNQNAETNEEVQQLLEELQKAYTPPPNETGNEYWKRKDKIYEITHELRGITGLRESPYYLSSESRSFKEEIKPHMIELPGDKTDFQNSGRIALVAKLFHAHSPAFEVIFDKYKARPFGLLQERINAAVSLHPQSEIDEKLISADLAFREAQTARTAIDEDFESAVQMGQIKTADEFKKAILAKDQSTTAIWEAQNRLFMAQNEFYADLAEKAGLQIIPGAPGEFATLAEAPTAEKPFDLQKLLREAGLSDLDPEESAEALDGMDSETAATVFEEIRAESPDKAKAIADEKAKVNEAWFLQALKNGDQVEAELAFSTLNPEQRRKYRSQLWPT